MLLFRYHNLGVELMQCLLSELVVTGFNLDQKVRLQPRSESPHPRTWGCRLVHGGSTNHLDVLGLEAHRDDEKCKAFAAAL